MAERQILTVIDCQTVLAKVTPGTIGNEASLGSWDTSSVYVYMISSGNYAISGQGQSELNVSANSGDIIQWTVTDPTSGQEYNPVLYGFTTNNPTVLTAPVMLAETLEVYQPQSTTAPTGPFQKVNYPDYVWQTTILQPGQQAQYSWKFVILDNNGTQLGAYSWDPFITIA